jgi:hypothetical protein
MKTGFDCGRQNCLDYTKPEGELGVTKATLAPVRRAAAGRLL